MPTLPHGFHNKLPYLKTLSSKLRSMIRLTHFMITHEELFRLTVLMFHLKSILWNFALAPIQRGFKFDIGLTVHIILPTDATYLMCVPSNYFNTTPIFMLSSFTFKTLSSTTCVIYIKTWYCILFSLISILTLILPTNKFILKYFAFNSSTFWSLKGWYHSTPPKPHKSK